MENFTRARRWAKLVGVEKGGQVAHRCILEVEPKPFCCQRPGMRCATERVIQVARGIRADRAVEILLTAAARLCLRGERPVSQMVNGSSRAIAYARELEEWVDAEARAR